MSFDATATKYTVKAYLSNGKIANLTNVKQEMTWSEASGELASRASITFANVQTDEGLVTALLKLCTRIVIYANGTMVFDGIVWDYSYTSALNKELTVLCYDKMIYLTKSKEHYFYPAGKSTEAIMKDICSRWGINLKYEASSITHAKTCFKNTAISDNILTLKEEADKKLKKKSVLRFENNQLRVMNRGSNKDVYIFHAKKNVESTDYRITMDNLVTKVVVMGKEDKEGRAAVKATLTGKTQFGTLQEVVYIDGDSTLAEAKKDAQAILDEKGNPTETMYVDCVDVPWIRKGDKVKIEAGNLLGYFYVKGITHNCSKLTMRMEVER